MSDILGIKGKSMKIGLLGASFDTGNLGVSALAESTIKCILHKWPDARIVLLGSGREKGHYRLTISDKEIYLEKLPIRFCKNIFLDNHFVVLYFYALLLKVLPWEGAKRFCKRQNPSLSCILGIDIVADITGGDSFSDIYGMHRFVLGVLCKWLILLFNKNLIMLPQTYGPFKRPLARAMARHILKKASLVYSRDRAGVEDVNALLNTPQNGKVRFAPDVAFILDPRKPEHLTIEPSANIQAQSSIVVGLNVSGLLFNGGYTQDNMFALKTDYRALIYDIVEMLLEDKDTIVLLVPHVFPPPSYEVESDPKACLEIYKHLNQRYPERIVLVQGEYDHKETKYIIGLCDFFIGSRMHACIAALSQCVPTIGLAYSKKFKGVFQSVGIEQLVVDLHQKNTEQTIETIIGAFEQKNTIAEHLKEIIPDVQKQIGDTFEGIPRGKASSTTITAP